MANTLSLKQEPVRTNVTLVNVLGIRNLRLLWIGEGISLLGDQFNLIALPWLVPQLAGNSLAVGTVLATAGTPRALFMLVGGALLGTVLAGALPKPSKKRLGTVSLSVISLLGMGLAVIGIAATLYIAAAAALVMGIANGYSHILLITWLQQRVAPQMTGRVMSLLMFAAIGLNPISTAVAGLLIGLDVSRVLVGAGCLMALFTLSAAYSPAIRARMELCTYSELGEAR